MDYDPKLGRPSEQAARNEYDLPHAFAAAINRCSRENVSNTPDFILGEFLEDVLRAFEKATQGRDRWYNVTLRPGTIGPSVEVNLLQKIVVHGLNCPKAPHTAHGSLHTFDDDSPFDVDGVMYCGRCHQFLDHASRD